MDIAKTAKLKEGLLFVNKKKQKNFDRFSSVRETIPD